MTTFDETMRARGSAVTELRLDLPDSVVDEIDERAAAIVLGRLNGASATEPIGRSNAPFELRSRCRA